MSLASAYRALAPVYDFVVAGASRAARRRSLARIARDGRLDVLIDGVGTGLDLALLPTCHRYTCLDLVDAMLARAVARGDGLEASFVRADSMRLPFADECFDLAVLHLIVAVVPDPTAALAEAVRVTRRGGALLLLDKFLRPGASAPLRRAMSPLVARIATRLDVVFEDVLAQVPNVRVAADEPALLGGWFRIITLERLPAQRDATARGAS